jgi:putative cell wall-binding protein
MDRQRCLPGLVLVAALLVLSVPAVAGAQSVSAFDGDAATTERLGGGSPLETALRVSQSRFGAGGAGAVVLSRVDNFADSLAGAALTHSAPLLLTPSGGLDAAVRDEILRVLPGGGRVYLLGGDAALSPAIAEAVAADGYQPMRLQGPTRIETAVAIAEAVRAVRGDVGTVLLARADGPAAPWADSVTGGAWAAEAGAPVLLTASDSLHPASADALARFAPGRTVLLGGQAALAPEVEAAAPNAARIAGADRTATAVGIADTLWGARGRRIVVNGYAEDGWAYGLAAAGLAADADAPLLLGDVGGVSTSTMRSAVARCGGPAGIDVLLVGPPDRLGQGAADQVTHADGGACPDLMTAPLPLPSGETEEGRAVSGDFAVSFATRQGEFTGTMYVTERIGTALVPVASAPTPGEEPADLRTDAIGHIYLSLYFGAHSGTAHVWGFEGGVPRLYPGHAGGFESPTGVALFDVNSDGLLELRVFDNDYDPSYVGGTTSWNDYGWTGAAYERVGGSPPLPLPPTPQAAVDGLLTAWRAGNIASMYGYASAPAISTLRDWGTPMESWFSDCYQENGENYCYAYDESGGNLEVFFDHLHQKPNGSWHVASLYTQAFEGDI